MAAESAKATADDLRARLEGLRAQTTMQEGDVQRVEELQREIKSLEKELDKVAQGAAGLRGEAASLQEEIENAGGQALRDAKARIVAIEKVGCCFKFQGGGGGREGEGEEERGGVEEERGRGRKRGGGRGSEDGSHALYWFGVHMHMWDACLATDPTNPTLTHAHTNTHTKSHVIPTCMCRVWMTLKQKCNENEWPSSLLKRRSTS